MQEMINIDIRWCLFLKRTAHLNSCGKINNKFREILPTWCKKKMTRVSINIFWIKQKKKVLSLWRVKILISYNFIQFIYSWRMIPIKWNIKWYLYNGVICLQKYFVSCFKRHQGIIRDHVKKINWKRSILKILEICLTNSYL